MTVCIDIFKLTLPVCFRVYKGLEDDYNTQSLCEGVFTNLSNEPLAVLMCQPAVVVQILPQVGESALYFIVRIGHPIATFLLISEEIWHVEVRAVH